MKKANIPIKIDMECPEELGQSFGAYMQANDIDPFFSVKYEHLILPI